MVGGNGSSAVAPRLRSQNCDGSGSWDVGLAPLSRAGIIRHVAGERILVVANETCAGRALLEELRSRVSVGDEVMVVAPALNSRLRHLFADTDKATAEAEERLSESLRALRDAGIEARGAVGDSDPVQAIEDTLFEFDATQIVISTHPADHSNWLEKRVVERAAQRFSQPITHVVVDLAAEREGVPSP